MRVPSQSIDSCVPFFAFRVEKTEENGSFLAGNHLTRHPFRLDADAVAVLRQADGEKTTAEIVERIGSLYPRASGPGVLRDGVLHVLEKLTEHELIWWRTHPIQPHPVGAPLTVFWEITAACNLRCLHCVVAGGKRAAGELSTGRCLELAAEMASFGVQSIAFSGGEPLVHPDFRLLAERVRELGLPIQVATNGTMVTPTIAGWLKELNAEVQVSLDGSRSEVHDRMRPGKEAFARTVAGIEALVAAGHELTIGTVLSELNYDDIPSIVALAERLGAIRFRLIPFVPKGRGQEHEGLEVEPHRAKAVSQYLRDYRDRRTIEIAGLEFEDLLAGGVCPTGGADVDRRLGCDGAVGYGTITPSGEVLPCHFFHGVRADNVAAHSFSEVWQDSRFLNYFRNMNVGDLHGACSDCAWLEACGGSCRAVNFAKGDLFGPNSQCWLAVESDRATASHGQA